MTMRILSIVLIGTMGSIVLLGCGDSGTQTPEPEATQTSQPTPATQTPEPEATQTSQPTPATQAPEPEATQMSQPTPATQAPETEATQTSDFVSEAYVERGQYGVGVRVVYFHDANRPFDSWNANHASDGYKDTLAAINEVGENQIVHGYMWYPADSNGSTRKATMDDFAQSSSAAFQNQYQSALQFMLSSLALDGTTPLNTFSDRAALTAIWSEAQKRLVDSMWEAPAADGKFPIIIAAHGLGGDALSWSTFAEYLASHGYVVVAPNFISDGLAPKVFDSPDSRYAQAATQQEVDRAYQTILGEFKVIPGFYKYFFGNQGQIGFGAPQGQLDLRALPDGPQKVGEMMGEFFTQRVDDVETIIDGLESMNKSEDACASEYSVRGQSNHGAEVCGAFAGSFDMENIGIMGHSLGSMTAQFTVARSERVAAAVGYNNGPPRYWEPAGIFGDGLAADGQPAGNPKPVMQIHGSEDAFVQNVFRGLMWNLFSGVGGNPEDIWVLEPERVLPTDENPQPIARNAYTRATGDKAIISVKDVNHGSLVEDFPALVSERTPIVVEGKRYWSVAAPASRKAVGEDALDSGFQGAPYTPLGWDTIGDSEVYLPTFVRNYFTRNWFDYYLKGDAGGLRFRENPIEDKGILDIRSVISGG